MAYNPKYKVYYTKQLTAPTEPVRIAPAPTISITPEIYYANDSIIGYTYNITLNGIANSLRSEKNDRPEGVDASALDQVVGHMDDIRHIFNFNGGNLHIRDGSGTDTILVKGVTIKSIKFDQSPNKWLMYAPFSIELESNEVEFNGCSAADINYTCDSSLLSVISALRTDNLVNIQNYKIKAFTDSWSFAIDTPIYDDYTGYSNSSFNVTYTISATGKNYYTADKVKPSWKQAKDFVQDRLFKQVTALISGALIIIPGSDNGCSGSAPATNELYGVDTAAPKTGGLLGGFTTPQESNATYQVYNETITCNTSESDGSFALTYNAVLKKYDLSKNRTENCVLHTFSKNISVADNKEVSISIQGTAKGLVEGGFISSANNAEFQLPQNGNFITKYSGDATKYYNAYSAYVATIGEDSDLLPDFKRMLNLTYAQLLIKTDPSRANNLAIPSSFVLDHSYHEGVVGYNATYESANNRNILNGGYTSISIVRQDPVEMIQEFVVPGRAAGPLIQRLGMKSPRTVSMNIEGVRAALLNCYGETLPNFCNSILPGIPGGLLGLNNSWILTTEDYTTNPLDGSFSVSLVYQCRG